jgi:outer membrane protein insertion porin family
MSHISQKTDGSNIIKLFKNELSTKFFHSFANEKLTLKLSGEFGNVTSWNNANLRVVDRFNLGEPRLRGFAPDGIGPRDKTDRKDAMGGSTYYNFTGELIMPIKQERGMDISAAFFIDAGSLYGLGYRTQNAQDINDSSSLRISVGAGLIINTPMLPVRIDFGMPIKKEEYDNEQYMSFSMSTRL